MVSDSQLLFAIYWSQCKLWRHNDAFAFPFPDQIDIQYCLRTRPHNTTMINKTKFLNDSDFIIRMLYKYSY